MWILFALIAAVFDTGRMAINKHLSEEHDSDSMYFFMFLYGLPILTVFAFFTYKELPVGNLNFLIPAVIYAVMFVIGTFLLIESNKKCDLSIVAPIIALTPIFVILLEYLFLGTLPHIYGTFGIILIVIGAYILNFSKIKNEGVFAPFKSFFRRNGSLLPFATAVIFSVCATSGKMALKYCDPYSFAVFMIVFGFVAGGVYLFILRPLFGRKIRIDLGLMKKPLWPILQGTMLVLMLFAENFAFTLASASYVIATKRLSALFGVGVGKLIFKEEKIGERAFGALTMVVGVAVLSIWG